MHRARRGEGTGSSHAFSDMPLSTKHLHLFTTLAGPSLGVFVEALLHRLLTHGPLGIELNLQSFFSLPRDVSEAWGVRLKDPTL